MTPVHLNTGKVPVGPAASVWAKSKRDDGSWLALWRHLDDSAAVAGRLWDEWLPRAVKQVISAGLPAGEEDGRVLAVWLAGIHDVGKATPAFSIQVEHLADRMRDHGLAMRPDPDRKLVPHSTAGQVLLEDWLADIYGLEKADAQQFTVVVGGHHGVPPENVDLKIVRDRASLLGVRRAPEVWREVQRQLLDRTADLTGASERLPHWRGVRLSQPAQALLMGVVIVADWIASNDDLFPYDVLELDQQERLKAAWDELDLPTPWQAVESTGTPAETFAARFELPDEAVIRPVQQAAVELARSMEEPGLLVIEAPMGEGKTEAALAAAEVFAARSGAGGVFVALPTRATSDAMFSRVLSWLGRLPDADVERGAHAVALAHGKSRLNEEFHELLRKGRSVSVDVDGCARTQELAAHQWLMGRKKAMLSSFVIGTVDQLLFGALKARHVVLRHLGMAGKVVIIDEAHAYDVYMSEYLDRALEWLGAYRTPVIVLSATLPAQRRKAMVEAYDRGRSDRPTRQRASVRRTPQPEAAPDPYAALDGDIGYPVLVATSGNARPVVRVTEPSSRTIQVIVDRADDDPVALAQMLRVELEDGGCALVVRNTVRRVQETARVFEQILGKSRVSVAHSRFLAPDRAANDRWLRDSFGPPQQDQADDGLARRPRGHVVVASQVAEQSLDIDFDLLVTDLAPVDLVLQRMGRLHRHDRAGRPDRVARPRCLITGVDWACMPPEPVRGSVTVYKRYPLLRALAVLKPFLDGEPMQLQSRIAPLVQDAYGPDDIGPVEWQSALFAAREEFTRMQKDKRKKADSFRLAGPAQAGTPLIGWLRANVGDLGDDDPKGRAQVRDTPAETVEVLVVMRRSDGTLATVPWLDKHSDMELPVDQPPPPQLARTVASCTLALPVELSGLPVLEEIERLGCMPGWRQSPLLDEQLVLILDEDGRAAILDHMLHYDRRFGFRVT
ncbi:CRISPR-associated endonuclease/helicase Cas3 [Actinopolymorpha cephalotaxi]|uniref:CRISPR-associated endonuclease/helicase Cas3 n=1 Tax=Actinopolymorpha cephalotaxi TaxID=504797 RepID=A0A1I3CEP8_9ACTN|nr:CRISPR-associated helicase/endonuclease Cas3 [Actinopolymorpha cephalotaxi]NYH82078.1 CRISPR-associated endonuclease/helicase Cas3 [Actinopolymorpha cephalotaxi]SFH72972.1 CRISPR-associated endonuclease/helicase Cas3 [Actinopolymorpha cephalotaxi]